MNTEHVHKQGQELPWTGAPNIWAPCLAEGPLSRQLVQQGLQPEQCLGSAAPPPG